MKKFKTLLAAVIMIAVFLCPFSAFAVTVSQQYINNNRSYQNLTPVGLVIHDTDCPGATAQNNRDYFNRVYLAASAHYFVDWNTAIQCIPENEVAWHAGPTANHRYLSLEMCMPYGHNAIQFNAVYQNTVQLAADICRRHGWSANNVFSHYWCSMTFKETNHEDPISYLQEYGKSWDGLVSDIQYAINGHAPTQPTQTDNSIAALQAELNRQGYGNLVIDNIPGPCTLRACPTLHYGTQGNITKWVQQRIGVSADGYWGPITNRAVSNYQKAHNLYPDSIIGYYTWRSLLGLSY